MTETAAQPTQAQTTPYTPGAFVWHEMLAPDLAAAQTFYGELFGWTTQAVPMGEMTYHLIYNDTDMIGGMMSLDPSLKAPPHWMGYISVADVDKAAAAAVAAGGKQLVAAMDIPNQGRFAALADPQGAVFTVYRALRGDPVESMPKVGEFCWDSLGTTDAAAATAFYQKVIGWTQGDAPQGPEGVFFVGEKMEASFNTLEEGGYPMWLTHIVVANLAAARGKVVALGGKVFVEAVQTPFGDFSVVQDPQGAVFSIFEGKQSA
jgi:predicted enzyme related to lactoylglutathione lyase